MKTFEFKKNLQVMLILLLKAETEEEAIALYNRGHYKDCNYDIDDMFYDYQFCDIREDKNNENF